MVAHSHPARHAGAERGFSLGPLVPQAFTACMQPHRVESMGTNRGHLSRGEHHFFSRKPAPPPFSSRNSIPAASKAPQRRQIAARVNGQLAIRRSDGTRLAVADASVVALA
jgi:hypothetical protein